MRPSFYSVILFIVLMGVLITKPLSDHPSTFKLPTFPLGSSSPFYEKSSLPTSNPHFFKHSPSITEIPNNQILCTWFQGPEEGGTKVQLNSAIYDSKNKWRFGHFLASTPHSQYHLNRYIRRVSNPILMSQGKNVWLIYVTTCLGLASSSLNLCKSADGGKTWSPPQKLIASPLWNTSTLVRSPGFFWSDGTLGIPVSHELITQYGLVLRLSPEGRVLGLTPFPKSWRLIQPSIALLNEKEGVSFFRDKTKMHRLRTSKTTDGGKTFSPTSLSTLQNPNKSIASFALNDKEIILILNPDPVKRTRLTLALSKDQGETWCFLHDFENEPSGIFDYPSLIRDSQGSFHVVYSYNHEKIIHATFNEAWIREREKGLK